MRISQEVSERFYNLSAAALGTECPLWVRAVLMGRQMVRLPSKTLRECGHPGSSAVCQSVPREKGMRGVVVCGAPPPTHAHMLSCTPSSRTAASTSDVRLNRTIPFVRSFAASWAHRRQSAARLLNSSVVMSNTIGVVNCLLNAILVNRFKMQTRILTNVSGSVKAP